MANGQPVPRPTPEAVAAFLRSWTGGAPVAFLDFEFNHAQDPVLNLVSCSLQWADEEGQLSEVMEWWLHQDPGAQEDLRQALEAMRARGTTLVGYGMAAEARSLLSLGIDPHSFPIVDLYAEWRQLTYNNHECEFGTYFTATGFRRFSVPPKSNKAANRGKDNGKVGAGLVAAVGQVFGLFVDSIHKTEMRDLILADLPAYDEEQRAAIMTYCSSDIQYLPDLFLELSRRLQRATRGKLPPDEAKRAQLKRGSFIASIAKMEAEGFPVEVDKIHNLRDNFESARDEILQDLTDKAFPFYIRERKRASDLRGTWTAKASQFEAFLQSRGLLAKWPRTLDEETGKPTDRLSTEDKVLAEYDGVPEIRAFRQARKLVTQLHWFQEPDEARRKRDGDFFDSVGHDNRQRVFLGPYGTQTSRNAPKASRFIPAMSSWLRVLLNPPPGWKIYGIDWASQEFALAAILSDDPAMQEAYLSGDPYLYFAKRAGAVPADGTKAQYKTERDLFKATTLGLQYGMGREKLAVKLTVDTGRTVTVEEADHLIQLHKKTYPRYWAWLDTVSDYYGAKKVLKLWDGWCLLGDNDNFLSVRNFPVQGTGATTMREAVRLAHERGLRILCPLHDAIYGICRVEEDHERILGECMDEAVRLVVGDKLTIRRDLAVHEHGEPWVEEKGAKYLELLGKYLEPRETEKGSDERLHQTVFAGR